VTSKNSGRSTGDHIRAKNGVLLTNEDQVLSRWKEHFEQHLNEGEEHDQPPDQVDFRYGGSVKIRGKYGGIYGGSVKKSISTDIEDP
jgi:hypothetical protein